MPRLRICLGAASPDSPISFVGPFPPPALGTGKLHVISAIAAVLTPSTDNAVMVAWAAMDRFLAGRTDDYTIDLRAKWDIESLVDPKSQE